MTGSVWFAGFTTGIMEIVIGTINRIIKVFFEEISRAVFLFKGNVGVEKKLEG